MKRGGVGTLFICSYLRALNRLAQFENSLFCVFKNILKICQCKARLCNDSRIDPRVCIQSVVLENILENCL